MVSKWQNKISLIFFDTLIEQCLGRKPFKTDIIILKHISTLEKRLSETQLYVFTCFADFQQVNNSTKFRLIRSENFYFVY